MKEKGFTLIELLAVILILGIIALITIPAITNTVEQARREAFKDSVLNGYTAVEYFLLENKMKEMPVEGISIEYLKSDGRIRGDLVSGNYIKEDNKVIAQYITNNKYCAYGELSDLMISKKCKLLDQTSPSIYEEKLVLTATSNSIKVVLMDDIAIDEESDIKEYEIILIKEDAIVKKPIVTDSVGTYIFDGLKNDTEYKVRVIAKNGAGIESREIEKSIFTDNIDVPTYKVVPMDDWSLTKKVTINYPEGYINEYSNDGGLTWNEYTDEITVAYDNNTVIARVSDGTNIITAASYTIVKLYLTTADNVSFNPDDSNWNVTTVQEALDYLLSD